MRNSIFLETFLKFLFYILMSPFYIVTSKHSTVKIQQRLLQKCLCAITVLLSTFLHVGKVCRLMTKSTKNPVDYFSVCNTIVTFISVVVCYKCLWTKQHVFKEVVLSCPVNSLQPKSSLQKTLIKVAAVVICLTEFLSIFLNVAVLIKRNIPPQVFNLENGVKSFIQRGRYLFFLSNTSKLTVEDLEAFEFSTENILVACAYGTTFFFMIMGNNVSSAFCLTAVATLWLSVRDFCATISQSLDAYLSASGMQCPEVHTNETFRNRFLISKKNEDENEMFIRLLGSYTKLKELASKINESFGELFFIRPYVMCFYYTTNFSALFSAEGWENKTIIYYVLVKHTTLMILSADVCHKMNQLRNRISEEQLKHKIFPQNDYVNLKDDMSLKHVGVSGMGLFTIDYGFLFILISTTMTYFLIVFGFGLT